MISGFNTDIEHNGTVYHVQTEDKGVPARVVMSLVFDGGTILASKRATYEDLKIGGANEKELAARVGRQHKLICAAISAGRINDLIKMTARSGAGSKEHAGPARRQVGVDSPETLPVAPKPESEPTPQAPVRVASAEPRAKADPPAIQEPVIDAVQIIEDELILPPDAVAVLSEPSGQERATQSKLAIDLLDPAKFKGGDRRTVNLRICRGGAQNVVSGAQIMLKVLGSSFRPVIYHASSDANGLAKIHVQIPQFQAGRAAILIRVISSGEEAEIRRIVTSA
ncbi:MAG: hypothetical protein ABR530_08940 [Pyrinomonadaceae bacterium]